MAWLLRCATVVSSINRRIGRAVSWLTLAMVLIYFIVVLLRYLFSMGSIALQESVTYLHAMVFMLAAAWTLTQDAHVRVDIFYSRWGARGKAWSDLAGSLLLLLPVSAFILFASIEFVSESWRVRETSAQPGGLAYVYLLKTLILVMSVQLLLQSLAQAIHLLARLRETAGPAGGKS